jgi:Glycosyl hydrolases family 39
LPPFGKEIGIGLTEGYTVRFICQKQFMLKFPFQLVSVCLTSTALVAMLPTAAIARIAPAPRPSVTVQVNWQQPTGITATSMNYGLNVFQAFDPKVAGNQGNKLYQANVESIRPGLIRYHNMRMLQDSSKDASGWIINPSGSDYRWDRNKISQAMKGAYRFSPTVMMNIPGWSIYLDRNGKLNPDRYHEFANFCADLVRIVNLEQKEGVKYWEVINEKDNVYGNDMAELGKIYSIASRAMKKADPTIKVGGPAFISPYDNAKVNAFLSTAHADLDFVSYHTYTVGKDPTPVDKIWQSASGLGSATQAMRRSLSRYPGRSIETFHSEFNISYTPPDPRMTNEVSAIYDALALVAITNSGATGSAAWNEADGWYGKMDNQWGSWQKRPAAYVHQLFNSQLQGKVVTSVSSQPTAVTSFAVTGQGRSSIALINRSGQDQLVNVQSSGLNTFTGKLFTAFQVDKSGMTTTAVRGDRLSAYRLPANTVTVLTVNP